MQFRVVDFDTLSSTNDEAMSGTYEHGDLIVARCQTAGRGQRGNKWNAVAGANLTFSLVIEPTHIPVYKQFAISEMTALAAADAICSFGVECHIKWPNDLYVNDMKIGGILIEHSSMGEFISKSVLGVGVNVNQRFFSVDIPNPVSLSLHGVNTLPLVVLDRFKAAFSVRYSQSADQLHSDFMSHLWRSDGYYGYKDSGGEFSARIFSISSDTGQLTLYDSAGFARHYWFKEVEAVIDSK